MNFQTARLRMVAHVRKMIRNGQITERRLARLTGISQPHVHNVLKGTRSLTPEVADLILRRLKIDLLDLANPEERPGRPPL
jgi:transcriptional regulator with XRE-family HTH domain